MKRRKGDEKTLMRRVSEIIVDRRGIIFIVILALVVFSIFSMGWVAVENDLTSFLPDESDSKAGVDVMMEEFTLYGMAQIMVANVSLDDAFEIKEALESVKGVQLVDFANDSAHYNNASACYSMTFAYPQSDPLCEEALDRVKAELSGYDAYISSDIGNPLGDILNQEILLIISIASVIIIAMILFTSRSVIELPIVMLTFVVAMIVNMGTNFIYGEISFVSNSVTSLLQLALSLDYAVILTNRFREEVKRLPLRDAVVEALTKSVPEVFGSSLTTVGGMAAMMCMQFKLGPDMAMCLIKAILLAMLSVFVFMPGLLMVFGKALSKTEHRSFIPDVSFIGKFAYKSRKVVAPLFVVIVLAAMVISHACPFSYGYTTQEAAKLNEQSLAKKMISDNFGSTNMVALLVPSGDYEKEAELLSRLDECEEIDSTMGLANIEIMEGYTLASSLTPRQFSEMIGLDYELAGVIYAAYAASNQQYGEIINDISNYKIPLIDLLMFATEQIDTGLITLEGEEAELLGSAKDLLSQAKSMTVGENYSRMVVYLTLPEDSDVTFAFIDEMKDMARELYGDVEIYAIGGPTTAKDFKESFVIDNIAVSAVSIITVLIVLLLSFKSVAMPVILIIVIQGAIWINFSIPTLLDTPLFFLGYIIISAIQMGANIDYAIVIATRYNELKGKMDQRTAIIETMNFAFPTVITSGTIMSVTGLLIGYLSSEATISSLGQNLGRGTIISMILVLFVLPQLLLVTDKLVDKTSFSFKRKKEEHPRALVDGRVRVFGRISGEIHGHIEGVVDAVIDGNANLDLHSVEIIKEKEGESNEK